MKNEKEFRNAILNKMVESSYSEPQVNNFDSHRFPRTDQTKPFNLERQFSYLNFFLDNYDKIFCFYQLLEDEESRQILQKLILYRILGHLKVKLQRNNDEFWKMLNQAEALPKRESNLNVKSQNNDFFPCEIEFEGKKVNLDMNTANIFYTFFIKQYFFNRNGVSIQPEHGDHVIDAGTCLGSNALAFAAAVGETGQVYGFDFLPTHLRAIEHHMKLNPDLDRVFKVFPIGLADKIFTPKHKIPVYSGNDIIAGISLTDRNVVDLVATDTIDNLVSSGKIENVTFIKMDIEGYELKALKGAEETIKKLKPKLAISIYHKPEDYYEIPDYIKSLDLGYKFYLDHHTIYQEETVLYARVET